MKSLFVMHAYELEKIIQNDTAQICFEVNHDQQTLSIMPATSAGMINLQNCIILDRANVQLNNDQVSAVPTPEVKAEGTDIQG